MYSDSFQDHIYDESSLFRFEVPDRPIYNCNEDRPYYAIQYQDSFIQCKGFNFATGKASEEFKDDHIIISNNAHSVTPYTKANIQNGYVIPQESKVRFIEN